MRSLCDAFAARILLLLPASEVLAIGYSLDRALAQAGFFRYNYFHKDLPIQASLKVWVRSHRTIPTRLRLRLDGWLNGPSRSTTGTRCCYQSAFYVLGQTVYEGPVQSEEWWNFRITRFAFPFLIST